MGTHLRHEQLRSIRQKASLTQQQAADRLGVSQPYLALLEGGRRPVTAQLATRMVKLYGLGPAALPLEQNSVDLWDSSSLAAALACLGYPGFRRPRGRVMRNPALILLAALVANDLEIRVVEALPWLLSKFTDLDWEWLVREVKLRDLQNRLGFLVTLAVKVLEEQRHSSAADQLREILKVLERARLVREDTLCNASLSDAERRWLRRERTAEARHWNLLTDLDVGVLHYAA